MLCKTSMQSLKFSRSCTSRVTWVDSLVIPLCAHTSRAWARPVLSMFRYLVLLATWLYYSRWDKHDNGLYHVTRKSSLFKFPGSSCWLYAHVSPCLCSSSYCLVNFDQPGSFVWTLWESHRGQWPLLFMDHVAVGTWCSGPCCCSTGAWNFQIATFSKSHIFLRSQVICNLLLPGKTGQLPALGTLLATASYFRLSSREVNAQSVIVWPASEHSFGTCRRKLGIGCANYPSVFLA